MYLTPYYKGTDGSWTKKKPVLKKDRLKNNRVEEHTNQYKIGLLMNHNA